jgi:hypothetical protein
VSSYLALDDAPYIGVGPPGVGPPMLTRLSEASGEPRMEAASSAVLMKPRLRCEGVGPASRLLAREIDPAIGLSWSPELLPYCTGWFGIVAIPCVAEHKAMILHKCYA